MNMHVKLNERLSATLQHGAQFADYLDTPETHKRSLWDRIVSVFYDRGWQPYVSTTDRIAVDGKAISGLMMKRRENGVSIFREMTETERFESGWWQANQI